VRIASTRLVSDLRTPGGAYGVSRGLDDVAVVNPDGRRVLVVYNGSSTRAPFAVRWQGRIFTYALSSRATATFIWRQAPAGP
jgi:glucosylceramidase